MTQEAVHDRLTTPEWPRPGILPGHDPGDIVGEIVDEGCSAAVGGVRKICCTSFLLSVELMIVSVVERGRRSPRLMNIRPPERPADIGLERHTQAVGEIADRPVVTGEQQQLENRFILERRSQHRPQFVADVAAVVQFVGQADQHRIVGPPAGAVGIAMHGGADLRCGQSRLAGKVVHAHAPFIFAAAARCDDDAADHRAAER